MDDQSNLECSYINNRLYRTVRISNGRKNGREEFFYYSGRLMVTKNYVDGRLSGEEKHYYEFGEIERLIYHSDRGREEKIFYGNDVLRSECNYVEGYKKNGFERIYHKSGEPELVSYYVDGVKHGAEFEYHRSGRIKSVCIYIGGVKYGPEYGFTNGSLIKRK